MSTIHHGAAKAAQGALPEEWPRKPALGRISIQVNLADMVVPMFLRF